MEDDELFNADLATKMALARKQRARTSIISLMMNEINPGMKIAQQLYNNLLNSLN